MIKKLCLICMLSLTLLSTTKVVMAKDTILTPNKGVSVSSGAMVLELSPVIVTNEFDNEKTTSSSAVILVFPYKLKDSIGNTLQGQVSADFLDKKETDMRLPTSSYYSQSINSKYFRTFGKRALFSQGITVVPLKIGGAKFPKVKLVLNSAPRNKVLVREIQSELTRLGYNLGIADGIIGKKTVAAIMMYQKANAFPENGKATQSLLDKLRQDKGM